MSISNIASGIQHNIQSNHIHSAQLTDCMQKDLRNMNATAKEDELKWHFGYEKPQDVENYDKVKIKMSSLGVFKPSSLLLMIDKSKEENNKSIILIDERLAKLLNAQSVEAYIHKDLLKEVQDIHSDHANSDSLSEGSTDDLNQPQDVRQIMNTLRNSAWSAMSFSIGEKVDESGKLKSKDKSAYTEEDKRIINIAANAFANQNGWSLRKILPKEALDKLLINFKTGNGISPYLSPGSPK